MDLNPRQLLQTLRDYDDARPEIPGEHWLTLAAGVALFIATRRSRSRLVGLAGSIVASLLVVRAATGRHGLEQDVALLREH